MAMKTYDEKSERNPNPQKQLMHDHKHSLPQPPLKTSLKIISDFIHIKDVKRITSNKFSRMFLILGLCISLLLVITAFEWKFYGEGNVITLKDIDPGFEDLLEVPITDLTPPPPKVIQPRIIEIPNDEVIIDDIEAILDVEMKEDMKIDDVVTYDDIPEEDPDEVFDFAEKQPAPQGGTKAFYEYIAKNLKYPALARRNGIEGKVFIQFIVDKNGALTDVMCLKGIGAGCDEEAVKVIESAPRWNPGKQRGRPVKVKMILPVQFRLE